MDLEHYWNIIGMQFPEDHTVDWLDQITGPICPTDALTDKMTSAPVLGAYASDRFAVTKMEQHIRDVHTDKSISEVTNPLERRRWLNNLLHSVCAGIFALSLT